MNPLVEPQEFRTKRRWVKTGKTEQLVNSATGEVSGVSAIHTIEEKDDAAFVKVFAAGVTACYDLTRTAQRVFSVILDVYQQTPMQGGYADAIRLFWFGDGLDGKDIGMSQYTFNRGLRELLDKGFLAPRDSSQYWVNPALFFKGDRVLFVKEYRRLKKGETATLPGIEEA